MSQAPDFDFDLDTLTVDLHGRIDGCLTIVLDRPEVYNALSDHLQSEMMEVLGAAEDRDDVKVVVITGSEESGAFASGGDIEDFEGMSAIEKRELSRGRRFVEAVDEFPRPVLAAVDGYALGGACELVQACDIRIATTNAKFGHPEIDIGLFPGAGGTQRLPRLVGEGHAMRLILTGEHIDAQEAHRIGLVEILCEPDALRDRTDEIAQAIASKSTVAIEAAKRSIRQASRMPLDAGLTYEKELFALLFASEDRKEGVAAFLEDREPNWQGQ